MLPCKLLPFYVLILLQWETIENGQFIPGVWQRFNHDVQTNMRYPYPL